jgi:heme/copper-type cytochrome/quinol oxidase subunit 3
VSGRRLHEGLGRLHFFGSFIAMNVIFFPMFVQGLAGLNRRLYDGGRTYDYAFSDGLHALNVWQFWGAIALGLFQLPFIAALIMSWRKPREADNPWNAQTLEWQAPEDEATFEVRAHRWRVVPRADTGVTTGALGMWLFLASEVMLFGGLFSAYVLLRGGSETWPDGSLLFGWRAPLLATALLAVASFRRTPLALAVLSGLLFTALGLMEWRFGDLTAASHVFNGLFFVITGLHMLHVLAGVFALLWTRVNRKLLQYYWWLVDLVWVGILIAFYV